MEGDATPFRGQIGDRFLFHNASKSLNSAFMDRIAIPVVMITRKTRLIDTAAPDTNTRKMQLERKYKKPEFSGGNTCYPAC